MFFTRHAACLLNQMYNIYENVEKMWDNSELKNYIKLYM